MATYNGIDISAHNGVINWSKLKNEIDFAIIRIGWSLYAGGLQLDTQFYNNVQGCIENNIPWGVYVYAYDKTPQAARKTAEVVNEYLKGYKIPFPIYYDMEESFYLKNSKVYNTQIAEAFMDQLESLNYFVGFYSFVSFVLNNVDLTKISDHTLWVAHISNKLGITNPSVKIWQYSWKKRYNGINGDVDANKCYTWFPSLMEQTGLNGYSNQTDDSSTEDQYPYQLVGTEYYEYADSNDKKTIKNQKLMILFDSDHPLFVEFEDGTNGWLSRSQIQPVIKVGSLVKVKQGARTYEGQSLMAHVYQTVYRVSFVTDNHAIIKTQDSNIIIANMNVNDLIPVSLIK